MENSWQKKYTLIKRRIGEIVKNRRKCNFEIYAKDQTGKYIFCFPTTYVFASFVFSSRVKHNIVGFPSTKASQTERKHRLKRI